MESDLTLRDLLNRAHNDDPFLIKLRLSAAETHAEMLKQVQAGLDWALAEMTSTRQHRQGRGEDELTVELVSLLRAVGITAVHDAAIGGHADISVRLKSNFLWLAECKLWKGKSWLFKGFKQLSTRYSTGLPWQNYGSVIGYFYQSDVATLMNKYQKALTSKKLLKVQLLVDEGVSFSTCHNHKGTGLPFYTTHMALILHFEPDDA